MWPSLSTFSPNRTFGLVAGQIQDVFLEIRPIPGPWTEAGPLKRAPGKIARNQRRTPRWGDLEGAEEWTRGQCRVARFLRRGGQRHWEQGAACHEDIQSFPPSLCPCLASLGTRSVTLYWIGWLSVYSRRWEERMPPALSTYCMPGENLGNVTHVLSVSHDISQEGLLSPVYRSNMEVLQPRKSSWLSVRHV